MRNRQLFFYITDFAGNALSEELQDGLREQLIAATSSKQPTDDAVS